MDSIGMENSCATSLTDAARLVQLLKINGYSAARSTRDNNYTVSSRWHVDGYDWEIRIYLLFSFFLNRGTGSRRPQI
jgi:speckle-type POZ protein